ncbi:MAG: class I tRNA ligase family protein, partial [Bacteroidales bacterium]
DPLDLIAKYGADGVRVGMLLCSPAGNDLLYDDSLPEQGRNFANKIWNAFRLLNMWEVDPGIEQPEWSRIAVDWFRSRLSEAIEEYNNLFGKYRISEALMVVYKLFWDDFSSWYLEIIKPSYQKPVDSATIKATYELFDQLLRLIHPFMPFITEEVWHHIDKREEDQSIMISTLPEPGVADRGLLANFEKARELVSAIRTVRKDKDIPAREPVTLLTESGKDSMIEALLPVVKRLANIDSVEIAGSKPAGVVSFIVGIHEYYIPVGEKMDIGAEIEKLTAELEYNRGFLESVSRKLSNEKFVSNAPESVVETERKKKADAESKIESILARIKGLKE